MGEGAYSYPTTTTFQPDMAPGSCYLPLWAIFICLCPAKEQTVPVSGEENGAGGKA